MIKLVHASPTIPGSNSSDKEVLQLAESTFTTPTPLLQLLLNRFEKLVYRNQTAFDCTGEEFDGEEEGTDERLVHCPGCGCQLVIQEKTGA